MAQETGVVTGDVQETPQDNRGFFDKVLDIGEEYIDQGVDFAKDVYNNFSKLDSTDTYKLEGTDLYSQEIIKEADKTTLDRSLEATGDFFDAALVNPIKSLYESEDSFIKKFTGTDIFRNKQSADTANEVIKNFYARDDVQNAKDPNKQAELQRELYDSLKPFIKPEKAMSDEDITKAIDELSISKQQEKYQKELADDKLKGIIDDEVSKVINKRFVGGDSFYNQGLIEAFKKGAAQELTEVLEMKKDLQISALEMGIDRTEVEERIAKLDKIIEIKKKQISAGLEAGFKDRTAFEDDGTGRLKIYNKAMEGLSDDEIKTLIDYERSNTKDLNTLLNVNRLNQLKKGGVLDRLGAGLSGIQGTVGLTFDTLDSALGIKTLLGGAVGRSYSIDDRESMLNALQSDENYLSMANRVGGAYVLHSALSNFDDIGQVLLGGGIANKISGVNKVSKFLDGVTGKYKGALATGAKGVIESYAYNNQLSMTANELGTDDYQVMNAIIDPFAENIMNFIGYMRSVGGNKIGLNYFSLTDARRFKEEMVKSGNQNYLGKDIEEIRDQMNATASLIKNNEDRVLKREILSSPEKIAKKGLEIMEEIKNTGGYSYKGDGLLVGQYSDAIQKASSPAYVFQNAGSIINSGKTFLNDMLNSYVNNPDKVIYKGMDATLATEVKATIGSIRDGLSKLGTTTDELQRSNIINDINNKGYKVFNSIKGIEGLSGNKISIVDIDTGEEHFVELEGGKAKYNKSNYMYGSKFDKTTYKYIKDLVEGNYVDVNTPHENIARDVALKLGLNENDVGIGPQSGDKKAIRVVDISSSGQGSKMYKLETDYENMDIRNLKLVQRGMGRNEIIGLLLSGKDYEVIDNLKKAEETLNSLLPIISSHIFEGNEVTLRNFRNAARLLLSSNSIISVIKNISLDGTARQNVLQNILLYGASRFKDKEVLAGNIMSLNNDTIGNITKAELISGIFTGVIKLNALDSSYDDVLKQLGIKDFSYIIKDNSKVFKRLEKVFDKIETLYGTQGKSFRKQFFDVNTEITNRLYTEALSNEVYKILDKNYVDIPSTIYDYNTAFGKKINQLKDLYGITGRPRTISGLLKVLKSKYDEALKEGNTKVSDAIKTEIDMIESSKANQISIEGRLDDLIRDIGYIGTETGATTIKNDIDVKARLTDILKDMKDSGIEKFDQVVIDKLKNVGAVYVDRRLSKSGKKSLIKYVDSLYDVISNMNTGMSDYTGYIKPNGEIQNYGDTPPVSVIKSILSFKPEDKLVRYTDQEYAAIDWIKKKYGEDNDIIKIRSTSATEGEFHFKLLNTKVGELLLNIYPPASMDIEPVSSNKIIDLVNGQESLFEKITVLDNYILNIQKYLLSRGISKNTNKDEIINSLQSIKAHYLSLATYQEILKYPNKKDPGYINFIKKISDAFDKEKNPMVIMKDLLDDGIGFLVDGGKETGNELVKIFSSNNKSIIDTFFKGTKPIDFYKAQLNINKELLQGTPLDLILKQYNIDYDKIADGLLKKADINIKGDNISEYISGAQNKTADFIGNFIGEVTGNKELVSIFLNDVIEGVKEGLTDKANNIILDKIIDILPKHFTQRLIVTTDFNTIKEGIKILSKDPLLGGVIGKLGGEKQLNELVSKVETLSNKVIQTTYTTKSDIEGQNELINGLIDVIINKTEDIDLEGGLKLKKILADNDKEIRHNISNSLRAISETVGRNVVEFDGLYGKRKTKLVDHSDGVNQIYNLKYLVDLNLKGIGNKYEDVIQYDFTENFYRKIIGNTNLNKTQAKTIFTVINNIEYITRTLNSRNRVYESKDFDWAQFGIDKEVVGDSALNTIYENIRKSYSNNLGNSFGKNYLAMPTSGEEAGRGFAINPTKELILRVAGSQINLDDGLQMPLIKDINKVNELIDAEIFTDLKKVLQLDPGMTPQDFAKRLKGKLAGGSGILRQEEDILSIQLKDPILIGFYGVDKTVEDINGSYDQKRLESIFKSTKGKSKLTDKEIDKISELLNSQGYITDGTIEDQIITFKDLVTDELNLILDKAKLINDSRVQDAVQGLKGGLDFSNKNDLLEKILNAKKDFKLNFLSKEIKNEVINLLDEAEKVIKRIPAEGKIVKGSTGLDLKTKLKEDAVFAKKAYVYLLSHNNDKVKSLLTHGLKDSNIKTFQEIMNDVYGKESLVTVAEYLIKEPTDGMGYMSRDLAKAIYADRMFKEYSDNVPDKLLPDLKSHMLDNGVFEKSRQATLSEEIEKHIREKLGIPENKKFVMSFRSAVKTGKDSGYEKLPEEKTINLYGTDVSVVGMRNISSNQIKLAASDAVTDKDKVTISMQYLAGLDPVMYQALQNVSITKAITKVQREGDRFKMGKIMSDNRGIHNLNTLNEMVLNNETELFNTLKGMSTSGSMLKLSGEPRYKSNEGGEYLDLEPNTAYVSEDKFNSLVDEGKVKSIGKDSEGNDQYVVLAFRNPVPSPYNVSVLKLKKDYSMRGKNIKIHPEDTFLKKEADFDADTVNLILEGDDSFTYKTLLISALKQTNLDYKHSMTFSEAKGNISFIEDKISKEYDIAKDKLNNALNTGEFFNKYVPTEQVGGVRKGMEKAEFAINTLQGATNEASVAKEEIGIVSVSQEYLYYLLNSISEYSQTGNLLNEMIGDVSISELANIINPNADDFYARFASILQKTLDYAKSDEKFDSKWLDNEIKGLMFDSTNIKALNVLRDNIESYAKNIKRFKSIDLRDFKLEDIENLPPVLRDRYTMVRKGLDQIDDLKLKEGELTESYKQFFLDTISSEKRNIKIKDLNGEVKDRTLESYIDEYFNKGNLMNKDDKDLLLLNLLSKDNPAYVFYKDFKDYTDLESFEPTKVISFEEGTNEYKALYKLLQINEVKNYNSLSDDYYSILLTNKKIEFSYDPRNFNYMSLIRKYGDKLIQSRKEVGPSELLGYKILGYNNIGGLVDGLKKVHEVVVNAKLLSNMSSKNRRSLLRGDDSTKDKVELEIESIIANNMDNTDEYEFIKQVTGITSFEDLKDINTGIDLEIRSQGENYELTFNNINRTFIDDIVSEIEFKNNASDSLRRMYNNIEGYQIRKTPISSFVVNRDGKIVNVNSIEINGSEYKPSTINVAESLLKEPGYRDEVMKKVYQLEPSNAVGIFNELEDIARVLGNKNTWNIFGKLRKYAPDIAERFTQRDFLDGLGLKRLLDGTLEATKGKKLNDKWKKLIENNIFIQSSKGKTISPKVIRKDENMTTTDVEDLERYQSDLINLLQGDLYDMINKLKFKTDKLDINNNNKSYLLNFLEIENGQHNWVLDEFGIDTMEKFKTYVKDSDYIKNNNISINESELENLSKELFNLNNDNWFWRFIRKVKSNMYVLAFSPILVPAALAVTLLQMIPDFFINISQKSKSFNNPRVDSLIRQYKILDAETIRHSKNLHDTMDKAVLQKPANWIGNILRSVGSERWKELVSNIELIATNGFAANDVILGPLRRKVAATRAFDTIIDQYGGEEKFFARFGDDVDAMDKVMNLIRAQAHENFIDLSGGSSTGRLGQTTIFSSNIHNIWNFMQTWSTSMVNQHVKAASNLHQSVRYLLNGNKKAAAVQFKEFSNYLGGQLRMNIAIAAALAKYQMVFNDNRGEDGEYDVMSYIKVLNNTIAGLEAFSPYGAVTGTLSRLDSNNGMMYNLAVVSQEVTSRFGRELNLPKNLVQYVSHAIKAGVPPEKIIDGAYDILNDRTNGFIRYNKFELQEGYFQDTYTTNLFGTAMGVNDFTSYQEFKDNVRKYGTQRAFEELSTQGQLAVILGSSNYIKMISGIYSDDGSFKVYEQMVEDILDIRDKDETLRKLISTGMDKKILDEIMITNGKLNKDNVGDVFWKMVNYSSKGLGDFIQDETGLTGFQWAKNPKGANIIDNLIVSQLNEKYGKEIVDAIANNDYLTISQYVKNKVGPEMLKDLYPTGSSSVDEASLRKMLLIASEKSELTIPTLVSTLIYDKAFELQNKGYNVEQSQYIAVQMFAPLANGNLGMVNDIANIYTTKKYKEELKPLFNNSFKEQFSKSLENKLLVDMAVGRAMYEDGDIGSVELRGDMTTIFNTAYQRMKEKNNGILSKEDAMKLMADYTYIDTQLNKLNGKVDPLKLFNYREGVFLSMLNKPDLLAEVENDDAFSSKWSDVKDNLTHRFLKFVGERKNYELDSFEELVKEKYHKEIGIKTGGYGTGGYGRSIGSSYKPNTGGSKGFGGGQGMPFVERAINRGINPSQSPRDLFRSNPYSYVPSMGGPKAYYKDMGNSFRQIHKQMYEQFSKDLVKRNPEYINKIYTIKKMGAERVGLRSNLIRSDYSQIPKMRYSKLSKGLIPGWAYKREM